MHPGPEAGDSDASTTVPPARSQRGVAVLLIAVAAGLTAFSAIAFFFSGFNFVIVSEAHDLIVDTTALVVAGSVAVRAWARYDETGEIDSLFQASAFVVLFAAGGLRIGLLFAGHDLYAPFERDVSGQAPLYIWTIQRLAAAVLLLAGAMAVLRGWRPPAPGLRLPILAGPALVLVVVGLLTLANDAVLPPLIPPDVLDDMFHSAATIDPQLLSWPMVALQAGIGVIYLVAALQYGRLAQTRRRTGYTRFLAVALVVAVFTQLHYAVVPGTYAGLLSTGDMLRLLFYVLVLAGVAVAARRDLHELVRANSTLATLRELDAGRIALEERTRLAREVHDGLVQELWLARLAHGRLREVPDMPEEAVRVAERVDSALDSAMGEARQAVVTLHVSPDTGLGSLLQQVVEDHADRFGLDVECTIDGEPPALPDRTVSNLLRICREALNNVRKHSDATLTRVNLRTEANELRLVVHDNGRGFVPQEVRGQYGLRSMRDRAEMIGGRLDIASAPMDGTRVMLTLPLPGAQE